MKTKRISILILAVLVVGLVAAAETVRINLSPDRSVLPVGPEQTVIIKIEVEGAEKAVDDDRPPVNLSIIIDKSGSMRGDRIRFARKGALEAVRRLGPDDIFSLVVFDREVRTLIPAGPVGDLEAAEEIISGIQAGGTTNIHGGMVEGLKQLRKYPSERYLHRAVLLSDGLANVGPRSDAEFANLGRQFSGAGIIVSTIGLGHDYNEMLLASLAGAGEGNNYFVDRPDTLTKIFEEEIGHLVSTVARGVILRFQLPEGIEIIRQLGRPVQRREGAWEINFHDLGAGMKKHNLLEVRVPEGRADVVRGLLSAEVSYRRVADDQTRNAVSQAQVRYSGVDEEVEASLDPEVHRAFASLWQAEVQQEVLDQVRAGRRDDARERISQLSEELKAHPLAEPARESLSEYAREESEILGERVYRPDEIRTRQAEAYQRRNQQTTGRTDLN